LYFDDNLPPTADGRTGDVLPNDYKDSYTIAGQTAFYQGLGGYVETLIDDSHTGQRELRVSGDTVVDYGFFKARSGYHFAVVSPDLTADYTLPGIYTDANAQLNPTWASNFTIIQTLNDVPGHNDAALTYLDVDKLVITNSDYPAMVPSAVPLPASLPLFGSALAILGFIGFGMRRAAIVPADHVICA
jgi:hypothetical protein